MSNTYTTIMELITSELDGLLILDVACGKGYWGYNIRVNKSDYPIIIGLEIWIPYIKRIKKLNIYNELIICDVCNIPLKNHVFKILIASEILEHLCKKNGFKLLNELNRICKNRIIISTPSTFIIQEDIDNNPYQKHISLWKKDDFIKIGYDTKIIYDNKLPKSLEFFDKIRRLIFSIPHKRGVIISWKNGVDIQNKKNGDKICIKKRD